MESAMVSGAMSSISSGVFPSVRCAGEEIQLRLKTNPLVQYVDSATLFSRNLSRISMISPQLPMTRALPSGASSRGFSQQYTLNHIPTIRVKNPAANRRCNHIFRRGRPGLWVVTSKGYLHGWHSPHMIGPVLFATWQPLQRS